MLDYFTELFVKGSGYSTINTARSALSSILISTVCAHPLVSRFMKGVFNKRPPIPRYEEIWDVKPVLTFLRKWSPVRYLSLKQLTLKLCCLLALVSAQRAQTLALLSIKHMTITEGKVQFTVLELLKQSRPGNVGTSFVLKAYAPDRRLCIRLVIMEYIKRTKLLRQKEDKLFISFRQPHQSVSRDTIARWVRVVLAAAGVDINKFKAHSTRAAATSAANRKFVPLNDILDMAGWTGDKNFQKYYNKPVRKANQFSVAVLS